MVPSSSRAPSVSNATVPVSNSFHVSPESSLRKRVTPKAKYQKRVLVQRKRREEGAPVRGRQCQPTGSVVLGPVDHPRLGGDVELPGAGPGEMVKVIVVVADGPFRPGIPTVRRLQEVAVGAHGETVLGIGEPHVHQRALFLGREVEPRPGTRHPRFGGSLRRVRRPIPACRRGGKPRSGPGPGGYLCLSPRLCPISRHQNVPPLTHRNLAHQPRPHPGEVTAGRDEPVPNAIP